MPLRKHPPTRTLRDRPDPSQLKRQAKELLKAFAGGDADAIAEVGSHYHGASAATFALHDAQLVLARSYGFESWPKLKAYVDGVTVRRLVEAVFAGDITAVKSMLSARPELVHLDVSEYDEHRALHYAVLRRQPEIVRLLMRYGADARKGIWPHRDATSPLTMPLTVVTRRLTISFERKSGEDLELQPLSRTCQSPPSWLRHFGEAMKRR